MFLERYFWSLLSFIYDRAQVIRLALTKTLCRTKCGYVLISYTTVTFVELKKFKTEDLCKSGKPRPTLNLRLGYAAIQEGY